MVLYPPPYGESPADSVAEELEIARRIKDQAIFKVALMVDQEPSVENI